MARPPHVVRATRLAQRFQHHGPPVVFLHLPKTAGTTFNKILQRQFPASRQHFVRASHDPAQREAFAALPEAYRHSLRLLRGHQAFGLHAYMAPGTRYLTILRDPVARVVSHYYYVKPGQLPQFKAVADMSLEAYAASNVTSELDNGQTRWIAGVWSDRLLTEADFRQAVANLEEHFDGVGLTEHFDESLVDIAARYRWIRILYQKSNVGSSHARAPVPKRARRIIEDRNSLDLRLYEWALARHQRHPAARRVARAAAAAALRIANRSASIIGATRNRASEP